MKDIRLEKLANNLLTYSVSIKKGENILIEILGEERNTTCKRANKKSRRIGSKAIFQYCKLRNIKNNAKKCNRRANKNLCKT